MRTSKSSYVLLLAAAVLLAAGAGEAYVLYAVDDPGLRLRLGLLCAGVIAWVPALVPLSARLGGSAPPFRRRFFDLRRAVESFIRDVTRLNWLVLEAELDPRSAQGTKAEIERVKRKLRQQLDEIFLAAGKVGPNPESDAPFEPRFRSPPPPEMSENTVLRHGRERKRAG